MNRKNNMALEILRDLRKVYSALNADEVRGTAHQDVKVGLMATSEEGYRTLERFLTSERLDEYSRLQALNSVYRAEGASAGRFDIVLCEPGVPLPANGYEFNAANPRATVTDVLADHKHVDLALGRLFPGWRKPVADALVNRIARENALFSVVTALPNIVPSLIELPWAIGEFATDTAFLTMNQVRLALMMAAMHNRPVGYMEQKAEIAAIVAGAFGWRALARELIGKIPLGGGLIPKAAVAFAGTYVVGLGLEKVNRTGRGLSRGEKQDAYADAFARGREIVRDLVPGGKRV
jgi:hypothetical protein